MRTIKPKEREAIMKKSAADAAPHITEYPDLVDVLPDLCVEYRKYHLQAKEGEEKKKELAPQIEGLLEAVGAKRIRGSSWQVTRVDGGYVESLDPKLLLEHGVSIETIAACTVKTPKKGYIQVTEVKGEAD
jgi:hypothetical protein